MARERTAIEVVSEAIERLGGALAGTSRPDLDARFEVQRVRRVSLVDGAVTESASAVFAAGAAAVAGEPRFFSAASNLDELSVALADLRHRRTTSVAEREPVRDHAGLRDEPAWPVLDAVAAALQRLRNAAADAAPAMSSYRSFYEDHWRLAWYGSSDGTSVVQAFADTSLITTVRTRRLDANGFSFASVAAAEPAALLQTDTAIRSAAAQAQRLLDAPSVEPGPTTVVLDPHLTGLFAHEALGHLCEADYLRLRPDVAKAFGPGTRVASPLLTVIDDPGRAGLRGSYRFDDEGTPAAPTTIVEAGQVMSYLHSRATAARFGVAPTGHARAQDYRFPTLVRMANTFVAPGTTPLAEMFAGVDDGLYLTRPMGGETTIDAFTFGANEVYRIRQGRVAEPVGAVLLIGNLFETLSTVDAVGTDLAFESSGGGCAKEDQVSLPVDSGGPHLRIRDCQVVPL